MSSLCLRNIAWGHTDSEARLHRLRNGVSYCCLQSMRLAYRYHHPRACSHYAFAQPSYWIEKAGCYGDGGRGGGHRPSRSCTSKRTVAAGRCDMTSAAPPRLFDLTSQKTISPFVRRPKRSRLACWLAGWLAGWLLMKIWQNDRHGGTARPGSAAAASRAAPSIVVARIGLHVLGHQRASLSFFLAALGLVQPWLDPKVRPR